MIENRLFFLCEPCGEAAPIAIRGKGPYITARHVSFNDWFREHSRCGETYDHFSLVYETTPDANAEVVVAQTVPESKAGDQPH